MKPSERSILVEMLLGCALADYLVKLSLPARTGGISFSVDEFLKKIGRQRLSATLQVEIDEVIRTTYSDVVSQTDHHCNEREYTFYFTNNISVDGSLLWLNNTGHKISAELSDFYDLNRCT